LRQVTGLQRNEVETSCKIVFRRGFLGKKRKAVGGNSLRSGIYAAHRKAVEGADLYFIKFAMVDAPTRSVLLRVSGRRSYCVAHSVRVGHRAGATGVLWARAYSGLALPGLGGVSAMMERNLLPVREDGMAFQRRQLLRTLSFTFGSSLMWGRGALAMDGQLRRRRRTPQWKRGRGERVRRERVRRT
jgi:hypothetical protein